MREDTLHDGCRRCARLEESLAGNVAVHCRCCRGLIFSTCPWVVGRRWRSRVVDSPLAVRPRPSQSRRRLSSRQAHGRAPQMPWPSRTASARPGGPARISSCYPTIRRTGPGEASTEKLWRWDVMRPAVYFALRRSGTWPNHARHLHSTRLELSCFSHTHPDRPLTFNTFSLTTIPPFA